MEEQDLDKCGIYCITCVANGKRYIGQSVNMKYRWYSHRSKLRNGNHYNNKLQHDWNEYGESKFTIVTLERCSAINLDLAEYSWIRRLNSEFNIERGSLLRKITNKNTCKYPVETYGEYIGVYDDFLSEVTMYISQIAINGNIILLGTFHNPIEAAKAYDKASFAHYGRADILNFPEDYTSSADFLCPSTELNDNKGEKYEQKEAV